MNWSFRPGVLRRRYLLSWLLAGILLPPIVGAFAEDVTTLSGRTLREIQLVRVEPDGVTWQHAAGICKVDFTDLPERTRLAFRYDPGKAAAYRAAQATERAQAAERDRQILQADAQRRAARALAMTTLSDPANASDEMHVHFIYRLPAAAAATAEAARSLGEQIAAKAAPPAAHDRAGVTDAQVLRELGKTGGALRITPRSLDATHDLFYRPDYSTHDYYQDTERAAAYARGHP